MDSKAVASVSYVNIVADVTVVKATGALDSTVTTSGAAKYVVPSALVSWVYILLDYTIDPIGRNPVLRDLTVQADRSVLLVGKGFTEAKTSSDVFGPKVFGKGLTEAKVTSETRGYSLTRLIQNYVHSQDDFNASVPTDDGEVMSFSKNLNIEFLSKADVERMAYGKNLTEAKATADTRTQSLSKPFSESKTTSETRAVTFAKRLFDAFHSGDEFNAIAVSDDGEIMVFGKTLSDSFTQADTVSLNPNKGFSEQQTTADQLQPFILGKGITDVPLTSEIRNVDLVRGAITDVPVTSDAKSIGYGTNFNDYLYNPKEGPKQVNNYALDYFASEDYCLEGFPAFAIGKVLLDTVVTTDDFYGAANADDDETMSFIKKAGDLFYATDSFGALTSKVRTDSASASDSKTINAGKVLLDTFVKADVLTSAVGKALADAFTSSDARTNLFGKGLTDSSLTSETKAFAFSKSLSDTFISTDDFNGVANPDDDEVMSFFKTTSDSFTKSDSTSLRPGKGLTDSVSKSDGGSLVWTDYWDINYTVTTSGVYVGNSRTF